jgi:hypothetical protein
VRDNGMCVAYTTDLFGDHHLSARVPWHVWDNSRGSFEPDHKMTAKGLTDASLAPPLPAPTHDPAGTLPSVDLSQRGTKRQQAWEHDCTLPATTPQAKAARRMNGSGNWSRSFGA